MYLDSLICQNHAFTPGLLDLGFTQWKESGIQNVKDLYVDFDMIHQHDVLEVINKFNPIKNVLLKENVIGMTIIKQSWGKVLGLQMDSDTWEEFLMNTEYVTVQLM